MRAILAILAIVGLLLSPVAASAAAAVCLHEHGGASMVMMTMAAPDAEAAGKATGHSCCDDDAGNPAKHDKQSCAQACAAICGVSAALPQAAVDVSLSENHARLVPAAFSPLHAHGPPGLKRPPKHDA